MSTKDDIISAQVVLFAPGGKSILNEKRVTSDNIQPVSPSAEMVRTATVQLQKLGFVCTPSYPTLSISGPRSLFEKTFHLKFENRKHGLTVYAAPVTKATIPPPLKNLVADVVFGEPMEPFI